MWACDPGSDLFISHALYESAALLVDLSARFLQGLEELQEVS